WLHPAPNKKLLAILVIRRVQRETSMVLKPPLPPDVVDEFLIMDAEGDVIDRFLAIPEPEKPEKSIVDRKRDSEKVAQLISALKENSYWPDQYRAAEGLGEMGRAAKEAVSPLVAALKNSEPSVRMAAARALGKIGDASEQVIVELTTAAKDKAEQVSSAA